MVLLEYSEVIHPLVSFTFEVFDTRFEMEYEQGPMPSASVARMLDTFAGLT